MLELGTAGAAGVAKGVLPVLRDGVAVAQVRPAGRRGSVTAVIGDREWLLGKRKGELAGRWSTDLESTARCWATQTSRWTSTWQADLEGAPVTVSRPAVWKRSHRYVSHDRVIAESGARSNWSHPKLIVDTALPPGHQVFLLWLEHLLRGAEAG